MAQAGIPFGRGVLQDPTAQRESEAGRARETFLQKQWNVRVQRTSNYTASVGEIVRCNPTTAAFTVTLPSATAHGAGASLIVKNDSASLNPITVATILGETIDGASTAVISLAREALYVVSDGTSWVIV